MEFFKFNDYIYVDENINLSIEDFDAIWSDIYHSERSKYFQVEVELQAKDDTLAKLLGELGIAGADMRATVSTKYDFRGRRTEEQRKEAIEDAREETIQKVYDEKYEQKVVNYVQKKLDKKLEYNKKNFLRVAEREFVERDFLNWDNIDDEELEETQDEIDDIQQQIDELKAKKREAQEKKRQRKNELFNDFLSENNINDIYHDDKPFPKKVHNIIKEKAQNGELFQRSNELSFLG